MSSAADLVGADIMSGDPDAVSLLATRMSNLAHDVDAMRDKFSARYLGGIWTGAAFDAFAKTLEDVPKDLAKVGTSYTMAASAVRSYGGALEEAQSQARALATQASDAEARVSGADGDRTRASRALQAAKAMRAGASDPVTQHDAQRRVTLAAANLATAQQHHEQAASDLAGVRNSAAAAVAAFQAEVRVCCQRLQAASATGIQNTPLSWYDRHLADGPFGAIVGAALAPFGTISDVWGNLKDLAKSFGDLAAWRGVLDFVGTALAVVTIALLIAGTGGLALAAVGMLGVAVASAEWGVDAVRVERGEISGDALVWDTVGLATSTIGLKGNLSTLVRGVPKALNAGSAAWTKRYVRYGLSGVRMPVADRLEQMAELGVTSFVPEYARRILPPIFPPPRLQPCVVPSPGLGASPVGAIRHFRPIIPRPIILADAA